MRSNCFRTNASSISAENLRYFREKYDAILANRDEQADMLASVRGTPYRRVERLHYDYVKAQRAEVESMLNRLPAAYAAAARKTE